MSIRKRTWKNAKGEIKETWVVNYRDKSKGGARVQRTFRLKKDADAFLVDAKVEIRDGTHIARSKSVTVAQAGGEWPRQTGWNAPVSWTTGAFYACTLCHSLGQ
jgi:integrase